MPESVYNKSPLIVRFYRKPNIVKTIKGKCKQFLRKNLNFFEIYQLLGTRDFLDPPPPPNPTNKRISQDLRATKAEVKPTHWENSRIIIVKLRVTLSPLPTKLTVTL